MSIECSHSLLERLPLEILVLTLTLCEAKSLISCSSTCQWLRCIIYDTEELVYSIELNVRGYVDNPSSTLSTIQKMRELKLRDERWSKLEFASKDGTYISCTHDRFLFDFNAGVYAYTPSSASFSFHFVDASASTPHPILEKIPLLPPSEDPEGVVRSWGIENAEGSELVDFFIDVGQDLLIYVSKSTGRHISLPPYDLHFHTLSTGYERRPPIHLNGHLEAERPDCVFDIRGHLLLLRLISSLDGSKPLSPIYVINWHADKCKTILDDSGDDKKHLDVIFLNDSRLLTLYGHKRRTESSLRIYEINEHDKKSPHLVCSLDLPTLKPYETFSFKLSTGATSIPTTSNNRQPFLTSDASFIIVVAIIPDANFYLVQRTVRLCLVSDSLLGLCTPTPLDTAHLESTPWAEWGPSRTRCTVTSAWYHSDRHIHGLRMPCESSQSAVGWDEATGIAVNMLSPLLTDTYKIVMFDFNQMAIARDRSNKGSDGTRWQTIDYETTLMIDCFTDPIITRLPFRFALSEHDALMGGILYDGLHLVLEEEDMDEDETLLSQGLRILTV
ncbi:hypothetical protein FRB98_000882 [Tulasnella sp. 332]|nr:hypothetical protein FRB98_000882 [Tulasnella sp. 332]